MALVSGSPTSHDGPVSQRLPTEGRKLDVCTGESHRSSSSSSSGGTASSVQLGCSTVVLFCFSVLYGAVLPFFAVFTCFFLSSLPSSVLYWFLYYFITVVGL